MDKQLTAQRPAQVVLDPVPEVVNAIRAGQIVIVADDEDRENEGDFICAAEKVTPETVNFMVTHGRGLVCLAMESERLQRLGLSRMYPIESRDKFKTAWVESVDAAHGITTGISAHDRAVTSRLLAAADTQPTDLVRPGHLFPLEACAGGVLERAGHTEAAVDLARLAGLTPAGMICEILQEDGRMARLPALAALKQRFGLKLTTVAELIRYRHQTEEVVRLEREVPMPIQQGRFTCRLYHSIPENEDHLALVLGDPAAQPAPLVRVHSECLTGDVFGSMRCDCGVQLREALEMIGGEGHGVLVYMRQEGRGIGLANKIHAYALQDEGYDTVEANLRLGFQPDLRDYGISAQILRHIGLHDIRLITNNPHKIAKLESYGVHVVERVALPPALTPHNRRYLETKRAKLGHLI